MKTEFHVGNREAQEKSSRVYLKGGEHQVNTIEIDSDGVLRSEFCQFSADDRDEAWGIKIQKPAHPQLLASLIQDPVFQGQISDGEPEDQLRQLLPLFPQRFSGHYDFQSWIEEHGIPFDRFISLFA